MISFSLYHGGDVSDEYALFPLLNKEAVIDYGKAQDIYTGNLNRDTTRKKLESERH